MHREWASIHFLSSQRGKQFRASCDAPLAPCIITVDCTTESSPKLFSTKIQAVNFSQKMLELYNGILTLQTLGCISAERKPEGVCATLGDSFRIIFSLCKENTCKLRYSRNCLFFFRTMSHDQLCSVFRQKGVSSNSDQHQNRACVR